MRRLLEAPLPLLFLTGMLLGSMLPMARVAGAAGWSPLAFAFWPALGSGLALAVTGLRRQPGGYDQARLLRYSLVGGIFSIAIPNSLTFLAMEQLGTTMVSLMFTLPPLFTYVFAWAIGAERYRPLRLAGILVGLSGAVLLALGRPGLEADRHQLGWLALALCVPVSLGIGNVYRRQRLPPGLQASLLAGGMLLGGALAMLPALAASGPQFPAWPSWNVIVAQAGLTFVGYLLYFRFQKMADAVYFSQLGYVIAAVGVLFGLLFFGETMTAATVAAIALIVAGIAMVNRAPGEKR